VRRAGLTARLGERRRRRAPRPDGPRTIVPPREPDVAAGIDAARDRLRARIAPIADDPAPGRPSASD
jgi:hypothetical protein